ncbi:endonuclease/exonuclease/phosphatase family protein [Marivita hallyeonensis]|uniref:Endonuclease/Exonuclease/phosphatase family protein n=1 Tax=Marivita hallyeonensis TaxID=996342 RepID=A0A1M5UJW2_9RHOB|nr:endonuclease/exonuclease/phosphatase family protein [Marivita hallyeonensis]SHH63259.1 Endonuclease/Exonuclease/phosphatase family protein [Marivita hallyeonensis]
MSRDGPGLLVRDLQRGDEALSTMADAVRAADPDILVLTKIDYDAGGLAMRAFADLLSPAEYPFLAPLRPNEGIPTGWDLDGDGKDSGPGDAQGYGRFPGQGGLGVISRWPIDVSRLRSFSEVLWKDLPGTHMRESDPGYHVQRLSSGGHWVVPVVVAQDAQPLWLLIGHSAPPIFDGPEDRNGRRNLDELHLWTEILNGTYGPVLGSRVIFTANTNLDPDRGDGYRTAMSDFIETHDFQDPLPDEPTAMWKKPGPMRVSYVLPSQGSAVMDARVWPLLDGMTHRLITVDIALPDAPVP